jgi:subtilisin family serine protease
MPHRTYRLPALATVAALAVGACADAPTAVRPGALARAAGAAEGRSYMLLGAANKVPADLARRVAALGGTVTSTVPEIGVAFVRSADPAFAAKARGIGGVSDVAADTAVQWVKPQREAPALDDAAEGPAAAAANIGADERFYGLQWWLQSIQAPAAWAAGARGAGARVAIIDGGLFNAHPDLAANVDVAASASFVPGFAYNQDVGTFWHGTHVAGIVAAADNQLGTIGVAPQATLIGVKVLHAGTGSFESVINGIVYAAKARSAGGAGANILNLSLGASFDRQGVGAAKLAVALSRATTYAYQQGATVIAAAGNGGQDLDHTNNLISVPAQSTHVIAVAALGPKGWALTPQPGDLNLDRPASYTNYGQSAINLAAPGGDFAYEGNQSCTKPTLTTPVTIPCWAYDMVLSTSRAGWTWSAGTSMASPAAAGVAALIVGKYGAMGPAQLEARLRASADDLGKPGNDDYYGAGRVNAARAVGAN